MMAVNDARLPEATLKCKHLLEATLLHEPGPFTVTSTRLLQMLEHIPEFDYTDSASKAIAVLSLLENQRDALLQYNHSLGMEQARLQNEVAKLAQALKTEREERDKDLKQLKIWQAIASGLQDGLNQFRILQNKGEK